MDAVRDLHRDISIDGSLGHWGRFAAAALSRSVCVDAQTAVSASVQIDHTGGPWFNDGQRAAQLLGHEADVARITFVITAVKS
jgi:hypothetical protein